MFATNCLPVFAIGDIVDVIDPDYTYTTYYTWFELNEIDPTIAHKFVNGGLPHTGATCTVVAYAPHSNGSDFLYAIETSHNTVYIIASEGLTLIASPKPSEEKIKQSDSEIYKPNQISFDDLMKRGACYG